ncbi:hypothetical protein HanIR_Chr02g0074301 [Helianthus annuus]|nr:hypothetical protein HanIR_Chr02g0074301 [Helianthus annuus]
MREVEEQVGNDSQLVVHPSVYKTSNTSIILKCLSCGVRYTKSNIKNVVDRLRVDTPPGKQRKSAAKRPPTHGRHQTVTHPYHPFTGARIRPKVLIDNLITLAVGLNEEQRQTVKEIGFGSIFGYKVTCVPTALANWLVSNYDPDTCVLNVGGGRLVEITSELVKRVFGLPMGPTDLVEKKKANKKKDVVVQEFRNQFEHTDSKRLSPLQLSITY